MNNAIRDIHILIVDDDENFRQAQKRTLRRMKICPGSEVSVIEASGGHEAMEAIKNKQIDCILLDHDMPGGSGMMWLKKILSVNKDLSIVMLTGQGSEQLAVEAMKNGAMDYLVKGSIAPEDLERAILNSIEKVELRRTVDAQRNQLMEADRQRVMIESLGTACHHIGQPATVISAYLQMMQVQETDAEMKEMITSCMEASDAMSGILQQLMHVSQYRTTPYLPGNENSPEAERDIILNID